MMLRVMPVRAVVLFCLSAGACEKSQRPGELAFPGSAPSVEALARDALHGLAQSNAVLLEGLRLTESEHNEVVWPELPASAPEIGFPVDFAWSNIRLRNSAALRRIGRWFRSNPVRYQAVECRGATREFVTFRVHTDCWVLFLTIRGELLEAQLFKDVLERDGGFKIFRYYDELPRRVRLQARPARVRPRSPRRVTSAAALLTLCAPDGCASHQLFRT